MTDPVITTDRLVLHKPDDRDTETCIAFMGSDRAAYVGGPMTRGEAWRAHAKMVGHWVLRGYGLFTITDRADGTPIGLCGAYFPGDWPEREIGWHIWRPEYEGKGIAYEAGLAVRDWVFGSLGWETAVSYIRQGNDRSVTLAERLGAARDHAAQPPWDDILVYRHVAPAQ